MIERQYGRLFFVCDDCGETYEASSREFSEAWSEAREEGWTAEKKGEHWAHWCHDPCEPGAGGSNASA